MTTLAGTVAWLVLLLVRRTVSARALSVLTRVTVPVAAAAPAFSAKLPELIETVRAGVPDSSARSSRTSRASRARGEDLRAGDGRNSRFQKRVMQESPS